MKAVDVAPEIEDFPLVPPNPLPFGERMTAARQNHWGQLTLRNAGGPVTRLPLGPQRLSPSIVFVMSPSGARDVLSRNNEWCDRTIVHREMRQLMGDNLADLPNEPWLSRKRTLQPIFTRHRIASFGHHMADAAESVTRGWSTGTDVGVDVDLDAEARRLTMRVLGRSLLGTELDERAASLAEPLNVALSYIADRGTRPVRAPKWLPTPARRRAREAVRTMRDLASDVVAACRADPTLEAPLVRALIDATDPETGQRLDDDDIGNDLIAFMVAGHDTTATTLAYALWQLGRHPELQARVAEEAASVGGRLSPSDVPRLGFTEQVVREAMRLCPPVVVAGRTALRDIAVDGYRIQAGSMVLVGIFGLHRDPAWWERPDVFDPERFAPDRVAGIDRWQYIPFGAGPRTCIGDHFAMLEAVLALATIVRDQEIESLGADFPLAVPFTMVAAEPIPARVRPRR